MCLVLFCLLSKFPRCPKKIANVSAFNLCGLTYRCLKRKYASLSRYRADGDSLPYTWCLLAENQACRSSASNPVSQISSCEKCGLLYGTATQTHHILLNPLLMLPTSVDHRLPSRQLHCKQMCMTGGWGFELDLHSSPLNVQMAYFA